MVCTLLAWLCDDCTASLLLFCAWFSCSLYGWAVLFLTQRGDMRCGCVRYLQQLPPSNMQNFQINTQSMQFIATGSSSSIRLWVTTNPIGTLCSASIFAGDTGSSMCFAQAGYQQQCVSGSQEQLLFQLRTHQ